MQDLRSCDCDQRLFALSRLTSRHFSGYDEELQRRPVSESVHLLTPVPGGGLEFFSPHLFCKQECTA